MDQVLRSNSQTFEICGEERIDRILVEHPRNADTQTRALFQQLSALLLSVRQSESVGWVGDLRRVVAAPDSLGGDFDEVHIGGLDFIESLLDHSHVVDIFDQPFFTGVSDNQSLDPRKNGNFRFARRLRFFTRAVAYFDIDEGPQAFVFAEETSGTLITVSVVGDMFYLIQSDEARL